MAISFEVLEKKIKSKDFSPVYFLQGDEPYYIDSLSDYIEKEALTASEKAFNQNIVYGKDVSLQQVISLARQYPMMAKYRVIIVKEAQEISDIKKKDGQEILLKYLEKPISSTILVFCHKTKRIDKKTKLGKQLDKKAVLFEAKKIYDNKLPQWIKENLSKKGYKIDPKAQMLLSESIGNDLSRLANEIDKLLINISDSKSISVDDISRNIGISKEYNVFELQNAIGARNILKTNKIIAYFIQDPKSNPLIPILASIYQYFIKILKVHEIQGGKSEMATALKVHPYFVDDYVRASKIYTKPKVLKIIVWLHEADLNSKGIKSMDSSNEILKPLLFKITHV